MGAGGDECRTQSVGGKHGRIDATREDGERGTSIPAGGRTVLLQRPPHAAASAPLPPRRCMAPRPRAAQPSLNATDTTPIPTEYNPPVLGGSTGSSFGLRCLEHRSISSESGIRPCLDLRLGRAGPIFIRGLTVCRIPVRYTRTWCYDGAKCGSRGLLLVQMLCSARPAMTTAVM